MLHRNDLSLLRPVIIQHKSEIILRQAEISLEENDIILPWTDLGLVKNDPSLKETDLIPAKNVLIFHKNESFPGHFQPVFFSVEQRSSRALPSFSGPSLSKTCPETFTRTKYRAIFRVDCPLVGIWSQVVEVAAGG